MATLKVRTPDDKHQRLKALAERRQISTNKLLEERTTQAIAELDAEVRRGSAQWPPVDPQRRG